MKNTIIWGFDSINARIAINSLKEKNIIDIKMWVGDAPECTPHRGFINMRQT